MAFADYNVESNGKCGGVSYCGSNFVTVSEGYEFESAFAVIGLGT